VLREAIACEREEQLGRACLAVAEELTGSKFGFIDELNAAGKADNIAISDPGWEVCRMPKSNAVVLLKNLEVRGIWASVIRQGCSLIVNDPPNHPDSVGTPPGHPPITSFLGVPLKQAGKTIGLIGLANKGAGYTPADQEAVEALSVAFVEALIRNRAEQALRSANAYNRSLLEASLDPLVTIGRDGRITDVNAATEKVTGCSRQDLVGNDFSDYFTEPEKARKGYQQVFQEGYVKDYPLEIRHKDGRINSVLYNASVYRDEKGEVSGVFAAARDITERKRMEDMLRESEERYRTVANFTYDWEYWRSPDGKLLYISPSCERITGYCAEEFLAKPDLMDAIVHPDDHFLFEQHTFLVQHSGTEQKVHEVDFRILRRDGEIRWIAHACQIIRRSDGTSLGRRATNRDITERKQAEEEVRKLNVELEQRVRDRTVQLEATNKELEAFSYSVSHDLRAPLRAIDGFSRLMLEDYAEKLDDEGKRYLGVIRDNTHKMGQLIDDLLTLSRLGRKEINVSNIDMARLAKAVFNETKLDAPERKVKCTIKKLPDACGDQAMIRQVFANLLSNAIKFTKPTDVAIIEIGCSNGENENVYCVKDNGVGFDMQYADKLFGVFQRLHSSEEFEGTGVGLALVQRIIFRHGGRVWAEGKVNGGACFYFTLPRERKE
jgi:PAS domain S-box-containing protein